MTERGGRQHRGLSWQASFTLAVAIVALLYVVGAAKGATASSSLTVTPTVMAQGMRALHYPVAHPKTLGCRGVGQAVDGRYSSFRCAATLTHHRRRVFYAREVATGGWMCAGRSLTGCSTLRHGFYPSYLVSGGWQEVAVRGWVQAKTGTTPVTVTCTGTSSPVTCTADTQTVTLTFTQAKGGYVEAAA